ncbi:MAG: hypothetical protein PHF37_05815 [Phycisphaerae bacterium]|nr:hypothetical protein [Phycisphaerae bacterium]
MKEWLKRNSVTCGVLVLLLLLLYANTFSNKTGMIVSSIEGTRIVLPDCTEPNQITFTVEIKDINIRGVK